MVEAYSASAKPRIHRELHQPWLIRFASEVTVARRARIQWHVIRNAPKSNSRRKREQSRLVFLNESFVPTDKIGNGRLSVAFPLDMGAEV
jgi:hypothetical protein